MHTLRIVLTLSILCAFGIGATFCAAQIDETQGEGDSERERYRRDESMSPEEERYYQLIQLAEEAKEFEVNYYQLLGVAEDSTIAQIKKSYYKLAKQLHPDVNPSEEAATKFRGIAKAYKTLADPETKSLYDELLIEGVPIDIDEADAKYFGGRYSKYASAPTHSGRNVVVALILMFSGFHYVYMWYAYQSELARAKKSPLYRARLKDKDDKKKKGKGGQQSSKSQNQNRRRKGVGKKGSSTPTHTSEDEDESEFPPDIEFVNLKKPHVIDIFTVWILLLPFRAIWRLLQKIMGIEVPIEEKLNSNVPAVRLSRYGYKEDYHIDED